MSRRRTTGRPQWEREGADWPNRAHSSFLSLGNMTWHVQRWTPTGDPPRALLLHGTGAATHSWRDFAPLLARDFAVLAPDLPAHGFTSSPGAPRLSLPAMSIALRALLDDTGFEPDLVIGHSAGAAIAINMTLSGLITPRQLVAINGALLPFPGMAARLFPLMAKVMFLNPVTPQFFAWQASDTGRVERLLDSTGSKLDAEGLDYYARLFACAGHCAGALGMMANWELEPIEAGLVRLPVPLHQVIGAKDGTIPPRNARTVAKKVRAGSVTVLDGLGHLAHEEDPARVVDVVLENWRRGTAAAA